MSSLRLCAFYISLYTECNYTRVYTYVYNCGVSHSRVIQKKCGRLGISRIDDDTSLSPRARGEVMLDEISSASGRVSLAEREYVDLSFSKAGVFPRETFSCAKLCLTESTSHTRKGRSGESSAELRTSFFLEYGERT